MTEELNQNILNQSVVTSDEISDSFSRLIVSVILILGLGFSAAFFILGKSYLDRIYKHFVAQEISLLENGLDSLIQVRVSTFKDHADLPMVVNATMHPEHNHSFFVDRLKDLKVLQSTPEIAVYDINGELIASGSQTASSKISQNWFDQIIEGKTSSYAKLLRKNGTPLLYVAVPIYYQGLPEGVLVGLVESGLSKYLKNTMSSDDLSVRIYSLGELVYQYGQPGKQRDSRKQVPMEGFNGAVELELKHLEVSKLLYQVVAVLFILILVIIVTSVVISRKLGERLIIKPQRAVESSRAQAVALVKKLEVANDELTQFSYRVSHDLKAPLITVRGLSEFIADDIEAKDYDEAAKNTQKIIKQIYRLESLIADILNLAKAGLVDVPSKKVVVYDLIKQSVESLDQLIRDNELEIEIEISKDLNCLLPDSRVQQIVENFISNSAKYFDPKKESNKLVISAYYDQKNLKLSFVDNGLGIPDEYQDRVFQMFKRFHPKTSFGSGLGLYLVKKHIDQMGGAISFESSPEGTTFNIEIPTPLS